MQRSEGFLADGQRLSLTGSLSWRLDTDEITLSENSIAFSSSNRDSPVTLELIGTRVDPEDIPSVHRHDRLGARWLNDLEYEHPLRMPDVGSSTCIRSPTRSGIVMVD